MLGVRLFLAIGVVSLMIGTTPAQQQEDWWHHMQLYQIYPRSFKDSNGDGIGDIKGITQKLQHLKDIGIMSTWLSPIFPSPMKDFGYDISDYYNVDPNYGTIEDILELIEEAKKLGIRILLDFVPNHTSDQCEWFKKSVMREPGYENFYVWHPGKPNPVDPQRPLPPSNWISVFRGSAWTWNEQRREYYLHQFLAEQPDLNYRDPNVVREMKNVIRFWLLKGVSGFRVDAISHLVEVEVDETGNYPDEPLSGGTDDPDDYNYLVHIHTRERNETFDAVYQWRTVLDEVTAETGSESRIMLLEAMCGVDLAMKYFGNETHEGAHFPFNFNIAYVDDRSTALNFKQGIEGWINKLPKGRVANWLIGNHDTPRVAGRLRPERSDGVVMTEMLLPGVVITYQGEEIAMRNFYLSWEETQDPQACLAGPDLYNSTSRDPARTPYQWDDTTSAGFSTNKKTWLPVSDTYTWLNLKDLLKLEKSPIKMYMQLSELRKSPIIMYGDIKVVMLKGVQILAYSRTFEGKSIVVLVNTSSDEYDLSLTETFDNIGESLEVKSTSTESKKNIGETLSTSVIFLEANEALVLATPGAV